MPALRASLLLVVAMAALACGYPFPRTLEDAEVKGVILRADGSPAATALASVPGTTRAGAVGDDGSLSLKGFPAMRGVARIIVDDDGDGTAEEGALLPFITSLQPVKKNITDGILTEPAVVVNGILYGERTLEETTTVTGQVLREGGGLGGQVAHVLVFRVHEIGALGNTQLATLPVEASASTADGDFSVSGVLPGAVHVLALVGPEGGPAQRFALAEATAGGDAITLNAEAPVSETFEVQFDFVGATERATIDAIELALPGTTTAAVTFELGEPAGSHVVQAPVGVFDLNAFVSDGAPSGVAFGLATATSTLPPFMAIELPELFECLDSEDRRDCDKDGLAGLPPIEESGAAALYDACAPACTGLVGAALDGATCDNTDCDDDADGVADVDERACVGPLRGTDADGDNRCEPAADPFPLCAENTIADCL